ncbi:MAG: YggT family protein [Acidimicrobiales bacterium]
MVRELICIALLLFQFLFLLRLVMGFFPIASGGVAAGARDLAVSVTDPVVLPIRRAVPPLPGALAGIGLAEFLVLIGLQILLAVICG